MNKALLVAWAVPVLSGCNGKGEDPAHPIEHRSAADRGAQLFQDPSMGAPGNVFSCSICHEPTPGAAFEAILPGAPLAGATRRGSYWGGSEIDLLRAVNQCLVGFMLREAPWTAEDPAAEDMYAYLDQLPDNDKGGEPVPFTVVSYPIPEPPEGDAVRGETLYQRACQLCHGALHTGEARISLNAPVIPDQVLLLHPPPQFSPAEQRQTFVRKARNGRFFGEGGQMPLFSLEKLSEEDMGDLLAYLDPI